MTRYLGVDLAWGTGRPGRPANETGLVALDERGSVLDAGWARGVDEVVDWVAATARPGDVVAVDAPLVVHNPEGMRLAERQVAQRYMSGWGVGANPSNLRLAHLAGVTVRERLEARGLRYTDGLAPHDGRAAVMFECYPYTTITGSPELGYDAGKPRYKRRPTGIPTAAAWRELRAAECDELLRRMSTLAAATPPLRLDSHPVTAALLAQRSPLVDRAYKHREDLLDAALCAWTAALWATRHLDAVQILGAGDTPGAAGRIPTIVAPARPAQRR